MDLLTIVMVFMAALAIHGLGAVAGRLIERRKNGAMAVCVQCEHTSPKMALSAAVTAAKAHKADSGHACMVVKG